MPKPTKKSKGVSKRPKGVTSRSKHKRPKVKRERRVVLPTTLELDHWFRLSVSHIIAISRSTPEKEQMCINELTRLCLNSTWNHLVLRMYCLSNVYVGTTKSWLLHKVLDPIYKYIMPIPSLPRYPVDTFPDFYNGPNGGPGYIFDLGNLSTRQHMEFLKLDPRMLVV